MYLKKKRGKILANHQPIGIDILVMFETWRNNI